jgi:carbon-monoxide dehydrogenase small subunit
MRKHDMTLQVNGQTHQVELPVNLTLLEALREFLYYYEVKSGCEAGNCGACTVLLDGMAVNACLVLVGQAVGHAITTVSGLGTHDKPHPLQTSYADIGAAQCGFCIPGMIVASAGLLAVNPKPTREEIRHYLAGNICRCTGYQKAIDAVEIAAKAMAAQGESASWQQTPG